MSENKKNSMNYWKLDYKSKFKRTMWMLPFVIILCFCIPLIVEDTVLAIGFPVLLIVVFIAQALYTYKMWKKQE